MDSNDALRANKLPRDPGAMVRPIIASVSEAAPKLRTLSAVNAAELAKPLPPVNYLVPHLGIAVGAPVAWGGYGFSGKTVSLQSAALSIAAGLPLWGTYNARKGRVLHIDHEQGLRLTTERYQRLARGMGIDLAALADSLFLSTMPDVHLDSNDALEVYLREVEGFDMVIVDSLRAAAPSLEENSSEFRRPMDVLGKVSEKTGACAFVIAHARKPKSDDPSGAKFTLRGSSALFDGAGTVLVLGGPKGEPVRVVHEKCRWRGVTVDDFGLVIEDVAIGADAFAGLRVRHMEPEQLEGAGDVTPSQDATMDAILQLLGKHGGRFAGGKGALWSETTINRSKFFDAIGRLEALGKVEVQTDKGAKFIARRVP